MELVLLQTRSVVLIKHNGSLSLSRDFIITARLVPHRQIVVMESAAAAHDREVEDIVVRHER